MDKLFFTFAAAAIIFAATGGAFADEQTANLCGAAPEMTGAEFWVGMTEEADRPIMTNEEARGFSELIRQTPKTYCTDILEYPAMISAEQLRAELKNFSARPNSKRYDGANPANDGFWTPAEKNAALDAVSGPVIVRFAVAADNAMLKTLPTDKPNYSSPNDVLFDMNTETTIKTWEPLAVLHASADGKWLFVASPSASGWMHADKAAFADRQTLCELAARDPYIVTGSRVTTEIATESPDAPRRELFMGTRLPKAGPADTAGGPTALYGRAALLPERGADGSLVIKETPLPLGADVSDGPISYTQANVIKQAFKMIGERYGWGGMFGARDCSSFIRDIYLTFDIELPRNSGAQTRIPSIHFDASKMSAAEKEKILAKAPAGTLVQMPGHIMLYLGTVGGKPYVIHAAYALRPSGKPSTEERAVLNCVVVSNMEMTRKDGTRVIESIKNINIVKPTAK